MLVISAVDLLSLLLRPVLIDVVFRLLRRVPRRVSSRVLDVDSESLLVFPSVSRESA